MYVRWLPATQRHDTNVSKTNGNSLGPWNTLRPSCPMFLLREVEPQSEGDPALESNLNLRIDSIPHTPYAISGLVPVGCELWD